MKRRRRLKVLLAVIASGFLFLGYEMLNKEHTDFTEVEIVGEFSGEEFMQFIVALNDSERGVLGENVYQIQGVVMSCSNIEIILSPGIVCVLEEEIRPRPQIGETASIRGRFVSFDDLFSEVRLDHVVAL
jgi:hypothetical protein|tara:strand:+ start:313 stop:702 length:390 start_codon:yes stop_codon:yes gene_type:complete